MDILDINDTEHFIASKSLAAKFDSTTISMSEYRHFICNSNSYFVTNQYLLLALDSVIRILSQWPCFAHCTQNGFKIDERCLTSTCSKTLFITKQISIVNNDIEDRRIDRRFLPRLSPVTIFSSLRMISASIYMENLVSNEYLVRSSHSTMESTCYERQ